MEQTLLEEEQLSLYSLMNLAVFYFEQKQMNEYEYYTSILLNVYPIHEHQKLKLAATLAQTGYYHEAVSRFHSLIKKMVSSHLTYYRWFSYACYKIGDERKAHNIWEEGCLKHPHLKNERAPWQV